MIDGDLLLKMYCSGYFPMWDPEGEEIALYRPDPRAIIELDGFHVPRRLAARARQAPFRITINQASTETFDACHANRSDGSWMSTELRAAYLELFERGFAHSVEAWSGERMVGGLYGVHIGAVFMAESKFSDPGQGGTDASKICLVETVKRMRERE
ncbi:MAG: leucyl/phenylalanyl-tRNA--protein transferase family protein, partial [Phycisphaerales bacterium]|nr:leucyl/phenylalanyl-tRNA--protein transferase family protein [Phycisphaerales bacterium]